MICSPPMAPSWPSSRAASSRTATPTSSHSIRSSTRTAFCSIRGSGYPGQEGIEGAWRLKPCAVLSASTQIPAERTKAAVALRSDRLLRARGLRSDPSGDGRRRCRARPDWHRITRRTLDDGRYYHMRYFDTLLQGSRDDSIVSADSEAGVSYEAARYRVEVSRP